MQKIENSSYTSAKLRSYQRFQRGVIEVNARMALGNGTWFAVWMLGGDNWPHDGEIDIMEGVGRQNGTNWGTIHTEKYNHKKGFYYTQSINITEPSEFHSYCIEWDFDTIRWFVDDTIFYQVNNTEHTVEAWPFNDYTYDIIMNLAIGGDFAGPVDNSIFPISYAIDYIRVYTLSNSTLY